MVTAGVAVTAEIEGLERIHEGLTGDAEHEEGLVDGAVGPSWWLLEAAVSPDRGPLRARAGVVRGLEQPRAIGRPKLADEGGGAGDQGQVLGQRNRAPKRVSDVRPSRER